MDVETHGDGYRVDHAIAALAAFVRAGDPGERQAQRRGETLYGGDSKVPSHPKVLSEGAMLLLPDQLHPAPLRTIELDDASQSAGIDVRRGWVRSRAKPNDADVQPAVDAGSADPCGRYCAAWVSFVASVSAQAAASACRCRCRSRRSAWSMAAGPWHFVRACPSRTGPIEDWNEQISLLTGMG